MRHRQGILERFARLATVWTGSSLTFTIALAIILVWLVTGPLFDFSNTWQLVINTGTTIITFLMVFLIQRTQNNESQATQLKLNELVAAMLGASNRLINIEDLSEHELSALHRHYRHLAHLARQAGDILASHSIEEAERRHKEQMRPAKTENA